jgi:hypothetical protein
VREDRTEECPDCGAEREREWHVRDIDARAATPHGWHVERTRGGTKRVVRRTGWVTVCLCDAP